MAIRYAKVRRLDIWLRGPNGLDLLRSSDAGADDCGGDSEADSRRRDSYCDSREFSIFR